MSCQGWEPFYRYIFSTGSWSETYGFFKYYYKTLKCIKFSSLCCWGPVEVFCEWIHQLVLLGHGEAMAIGPWVTEWGPASASSHPGISEIWWKLSSVLVFAHVLVPLAELMSSVLWSLGWIKPAGPTPWVRGGGRGNTQLPRALFYVVMETS